MRIWGWKNNGGIFISTCKRHDFLFSSGKRSRKASDRRLNSIERGTVKVFLSVGYRK